MLKEDFENKLEKKFPNYKEYYEVVEYISFSNIIVKDKYGLLKQIGGHLYEKKIPSIATAINKVEYVKNVLNDYFKDYNKYFNVVDVVYEKIKGRKELRVITEDKFGKCLNSIGHLKQNKIPNIQSAINKQEYFLNKLLIRNRYFKEGIFSVESAYTNNSTNILVKTEFGLCSTRPSNILNGDLPTIECAVNKTEYFLAKLKHQQPTVYKKLQFNKFEYEKNNRKATVFCHKHGDIDMTPSVLLRGGGCEKCGYVGIKSGWRHSHWQKAGEKSKNFDSFKVYVIRCWNDEEEFYKIGKTYRTINTRFFKSTLPYEYEVIKIFESKEEGAYISALERELQKQNRDTHYTPIIPFKGMYECFKQVNYEL